MFELDPARRDELVERWARRAVDAGYGPAAVFLLEAHKPIAGIGAQAILAFQPLLAALAPLDFGELAAFLSEPENVEKLAARIDALEDARQAARRALRARRQIIRARARRWRELRRRAQHASQPGHAGRRPPDSH